MDKRVPIAIIGTILIQTLLLGWWASKLDSRVTQLEITDARILSERDVRRKSIDEKFDFLFGERQRMTKVETQLDFVFQSVKRIEQKLDQPPTR